MIPDRDRGKRADFTAHKDGQSKVVEVKYIRPPDKLEEFLFRWWQAQKEVAGTIPLGPLPHLMFEWTAIESRTEISYSEILCLKTFFTNVLLEPNRPQSVCAEGLDK